MTKKQRKEFTDLLTNIRADIAEEECAYREAYKQYSDAADLLNSSNAKLLELKIQRALLKQKLCEP